jgi:hypothetical protein
MPLKKIEIQKSTQYLEELLLNINKMIDVCNKEKTSKKLKENLKNLIGLCEKYVSHIPFEQRSHMKLNENSIDRLKEESPALIDIINLQKQAVRLLYLTKFNDENLAKSRWNMVSNFFITDFPTIKRPFPTKKLELEFINEFKYQGDIDIGEWVHQTNPLYQDQHLWTYNEIIQSSPKKIFI